LFGIVLLATLLAIQAMGASVVLGGGLTLLLASILGGVVALRLDGHRAGALGFPLSASVPGELGKGLLLGVALGGVLSLLLLATGGLTLTWESGTPWQYLSGAWASLAFLALPAAAEEALARGYPLQLLAARIGGGPALILTSLGFSALHYANPGVGLLSGLSLALAGVLLGVVYLRTLSLWWATGAHLGWNWSLGFLVDQPISGLELIDAAYVVTAPQGPVWWSGGAFGPEGSVAASLVLLAAIFWLVRGSLLRPEAAALAAGPLHASQGGMREDLKGTPESPGSSRQAVLQNPRNEAIGDR